jgi:hypothetical protein
MLYELKMIKTAITPAHEHEAKKPALPAAAPLAVQE